jgi:hypothetical protein
MNPDQSSPQPTPTTPPVQNNPQPQNTSKGPSKHLILILLIIFPPAAWYYMWKENRYHNWFASVLIVDGLIFIATAILFLLAIYYPITQASSTLGVTTPEIASTIQYVFIALGVIEIIYGLFLRLKTHHFTSLPKSYLIAAIILLTIHYVGLPLGQIASYASTISRIYNGLTSYSSVPNQQTPTTPEPSISWKTYKNTTHNFEIQYPSNWTYDTFEGDNGIVLKPLNDKKYNEKYNGVLQISPGGFGTEKITSFENWIRTKGNQEIQGLGTINSLTTITTEYGTKGYKVIWNIEPGSPTQDPTMTIYYFQLPNTTTPSYMRMTPNDPGYEEITSQIINTFSFLSIPSVTPSSTPSKNPTEEPVFCTMDAKLCPDGSSVGRVGPNCEFAPCPGN